MMHVFMAGEAFTRKAKECPVQVLHLDCGLLTFHDILGIVTLLAGEFGVPTFQDIASLSMIE